MSGRRDALARAWGLPRPVRPGPKAAFTLERVLDEGIALADRQGLAAMSLGRIASALGITTNALYRYVESVEELRALARDRALGPPPSATRRRTDWQRRARDWAHELRARYDEHPWLAELEVSAPTSPNALAWLDLLLAALDESGAPASDHLRIAALFDALVRADAIAARDSADPPPPDALLPLVEGRGLERVATLVAGGHYAPVPRGEDLEFGLQIVLAGVSARPAGGPTGGAAGD